VAGVEHRVCALHFLYSVTLRQPNLPKPIPHAREPRKLPVVLAADEVVHFLEAMPSLKCLAARTIAYSMLSAGVQGIINAFADSRGLRIANSAHVLVCHRRS